jgi:hypothetical protein
MEINYFSSGLSCIIIFGFLIAGLLVPGGFWLFWFWLLLLPTWGWTGYRRGYVFYKYVPEVTTSTEKKKLIPEIIQF